MANKVSLLIVDDELKFLAAIAQRLEMRGFEVTTASNGSDALAAAHSQRFDLALLDLKMPGMNGREVLEALRKEHAHLEIIILTGHGSLDSAVECTKLGAFGYLPKPYEFEKLIDVLKQAYEHRLQRKFEHQEDRRQELMRRAMSGGSALAILRSLRELDDEEK